jgi:glucose-1-phosphate adenylyltransferase
MEKTLLEYLVEKASAHGQYDFIQDVLMRNVNKLKIYGYRYGGYVARLNSPNSFFAANMDLLDQKVRQDLFSEDHPVYTKVKDEVPARYGPRAHAANSIVADGCVIEGEIENCVLFRGVYVAEGAKLKNCIAMQGAQIQENSELSNVVLDKSVIVKRDGRSAGMKAIPCCCARASSYNYSRRNA